MPDLAPGIPPIYDEHGNVVPPVHPDEQYLALGRRLVQAHAGGWDPGSLVGRNAMEEFHGFIQETRARALEELANQVDPSGRGYQLVGVARIREIAAQVRVAPLPRNVYDD